MHADHAAALNSGIGTKRYKQHQLLLLRGTNSQSPSLYRNFFNLAYQALGGDHDRGNFELIQKLVITAQNPP